MTQARPQFCAVIVSYHTGISLDACLQALLAAGECGQIIVVNNGNPSGVVLKLKALAQGNPRLMLLDEHGNVGFAKGCNLGAAHAQQDYLVFVNPDCIIDEGCLAAFGQALSDYPTALMGGALRNPDGSEQRGCRRGELTLLSAIVSFTGLGRPGEAAGIWRDFNRTREPFPQTIEQVPVVSGALMAIARPQFEALGGFDPAYFLHVEDVDLCKRAAKAGINVLFVPGATAVHVGATSATTNWALARAKIASFLYYFWTHAQGFRARALVLLVMPFLAAAIVGRALVSALR
jgi:N-acetylglucosaminyl-diphospho-decaprenol L-rhamnosyltransferase